MFYLGSKFVAHASKPRNDKNIKMFFPMLHHKKSLIKPQFNMAPPPPPPPYPPCPFLAKIFRFSHFHQF